jgi:hypothetical protein
MLVAVSSRDGDLVTALGAAAAEHRGTGFGLHAREEAMRLGAMTAVRLEGTLGHGTFFSCGNRVTEDLLLFLAAVACFECVSMSLIRQAPV